MIRIPLSERELDVAVKILNIDEYSELFICESGAILIEDANKCYSFISDFYTLNCLNENYMPDKDGLITLDILEKIAPFRVFEDHD